MQDIRCQCGKIVCQVQNIPVVPKAQATPQEGTPAAVILCRHCKRYVVLQMPVLTGVAYATSVSG